jgi:hypothetical protein
MLFCCFILFKRVVGMGPGARYRVKITHPLLVVVVVAGVVVVVVGSSSSRSSSSRR